MLQPGPPSPGLSPRTRSPAPVPPHRDDAELLRLATRLRGLGDDHEQRRARLEAHCGHVRLLPGRKKPAFELLVLGCGGGPIESNLSCYLVKPYARRWAEGCTSLEGGSTIGALSSLIERSPYSFEGFNLGMGVDSHELELSEQARSRDDEREPGIGVGREGGGKKAGRIWEMISCFAITHSHLDHIAGLIISSAACTPPPKPVYGLPRTLHNIQRVMDGGIWPMLGGFDDSVKAGRAYLYKEVPESLPLSTPFPLSASLEFTAFPISHGLDPSHSHRPPRLRNDTPDAVEQEEKKPQAYDSTAFFVRETESGEGRELLFFGDVEPDSISARPLNRRVWEHAAPKIVAGKLSVIFLECSYPSSQPSDKLFGHLSPPFVLEELEVLSGLVKDERRKAGWTDEAKIAREPLEGVFVVIQHIKDDIFSTPAVVPPRAPASTNVSSGLSATTPPPYPASTLFSPSAVTPRQPSPLSMSPPIPTPPTRRPSVQLTSSGLGPSFPSTSSASYYHRRPSLFCTTTTSSSASSMAAAAAGRSPPHTPPRVGRKSDDLGSPKPGGGGKEAGAEHDPLALGGGADGGPRRKSMPWAFTFGAVNNPFAKATGRRKRSVVAGKAAALDGHPPTAGGGDRTLEPVGTSDHADTSDEAAAGEAEEEEEADNAAPEDDEDTVEETMHERIERELNELELDDARAPRTGVTFVIARQGMRLVF
ncbi:hypothetical protein JCM1841_003853 [Sporobolomyces salmonicolor]